MNRLLTAVFVAFVVAGTGVQVATSPPQGTSTPKPAVQTPQTPAQPAKPAAQTPPQPAPQTPKPAAPAASQTASRTSAWLFVTTPTGAPIADAKVTLAGPVDREGVTSREGTVRFTALRAGTYRARFDADGYILFEKEVTVRAGQVQETEVALNTEPAKQVEAPPPPPPPVPKPVEPPSEPAGEVSVLSLSDWIERNLLGRNEPQKLSPVGQVPGAAAAVLQLREPVTGRVHPDGDEMLYVVAGEGTAKFGDRTQNLSAGWLVVVPRDTPYTLERRGRNPMILLSVVAPARAAGTGPR